MTAPLPPQKKVEKKTKSSTSRGMRNRKPKNQTDEPSGRDVPATPIVGCSIFGGPLWASKCLSALLCVWRL